MGSGLILLVIVGAWLAVLVPMALRSHDAGASLSSVDRFGDAMRVLSRRDSSARLPEPVVEDLGPTPAQRRQRLLVGLVAVALVTLLLGLVGPAWLLGLHLLADAALVAYVVHLRRLALARAARPAPVRAPRPRVEERPAAVRVRIAGIPDRMPARVPLPGAAAAAAPAARYEDPLPAGTWDPVPVPVPTYVTAPVAPPRPQRVVDLTQPGRWTEQHEFDTDDPGRVAPAEELPEPRRRAVNDW